MIIGTLLGSLVTFLQVLIDPVEYLSLQNRLICELYECKGRFIIYSNCDYYYCLYLWLPNDGII